MYTYTFTIYNVCSEAQYLWEKMSCYEIETDCNDYFQIERQISNMVSEIHQDNDYDCEDEDFFSEVEQKLTEAFGKDHWKHSRLTVITGRDEDI